MDEQSPPRVTALVVSRNGEAELRRCLDSLERSEGRENLEILVVDDGSSDGTAQVPDDYANVVALKLPKRLGWTRAVNIGLRTAKGEMILLLPPRFAAEPNAIMLLAGRLESSPDAGAVCPSIQRAWPFPAPPALIEGWRTGELPGAVTLPNGDQNVDYPLGAPVLVRREMLRAINYLDARFGHQWADLELFWRIRDGGKTILVAGEAKVVEEPQPVREPSPLEWTDSGSGAATWIGMHYGFAAGLRARLSMAFHALGRGSMNVFTGILSGSRIDGNQE